MMLIFLITGYTAIAQTTQTFTGSGTFVVPAGVTTVQVEAWGGGGAGGGTNASANRGGGGGAGGSYTNNTSVAVTPGASITVTVGAGGLGASNANGGAGGTSTFASGTPVTAVGGAGGNVGNNTTNYGAGAGVTTGITRNGGSGSNASSGSFTSGAGGGGAGSTGNGGNASGITGGAGGAGGGGTGAAGLSGGSANGNDATALSAGGGGARGSSGNFLNRIGGDGFRGQVKVTWTCPSYSLTSTTVGSPLCVTNTATVTLTGNAANLPLGTYTVTYNQSAPNSATGVTKTMTVTTAGTGSFTTNALANAGATTITITNLTSGATGGTCSSAISTNNTASVTVNALPTANAGTDVTTCSNAGAVNITAGATATGTSFLWTSSGSGTFTDATSLSLATYTPSGADIAAGSVVLTLTSSNSPCADVSDTKTLFISPAPAVTGTAICQGGSGSLTATATCPTGSATASGTNTNTFQLTNTSPVHSITLPVSGVPAGATITDVNVSVTIAHNYQADVVLALSTPGGGTTVSLTGPTGAGNATNLGNTTGTITETSTGAVATYTFDQAASTAAWGSNNPATAGSFKPASGGGSMNTFNGLSTINGNWILTADDDANNDNGLITAVTVTIQYSFPAVIAWYTVPTGGTVVQEGSPFNPVGDAEVIAQGGIYANLANSNTPGTYTFYAACSSTPTCREAVTFVIDASASANAGADISLCSPVSHTLAGTIGGAATSSTWTTSGDGTFNDAGMLNANYTFGANDIATGSVTLTLTTDDPAGVCLAASDNMVVTIRTAIASNPVTATGPSSVCPPSTNHTLSVTPVADADSYSWVPGPTTTGVTFNGPTNGSSVNVDYGTTSNSSYSIRVYAVNACGTSTGYYSVFTRRSVGAPANPSGATVACANDVKTYTIPAVTGAETYTWSGPAGSLINGNPTPYTAAALTSVNVTFPSGFTSGQVGVAASVACYTSVTKTINVSVATVSTGVITGSTYTVCPGSSYTYSVVPVANAVSYNWTLPNHVTGSSSSNSINVTIQPGFNSANIKVAAVSVCGIASAQQQKTLSTGVASKPASITGPVNGMCGQTVVNTCPTQAGVTYNWSVPGTATINSGQGTNAVNVTYGTFTTGTVCVTATNACGTSPSRCITVSGAPATPSAITATPGSWCDNTSGVEFNANVSNVTGSYTLSWMYPGATVCTYVLGGGNSTNLVLDWVTGGGNVIVTTSNACGNGSRIFYAASSCRQGETESSVSSQQLTVSPNPANDVININFTSAQNGMTTVTVTDLSGRVMINEMRDAQTGSNMHSLNVSHLAKGIYMVSVVANNEIKQSRIAIE